MNSLKVISREQRINPLTKLDCIHIEIEIHDKKGNVIAKMGKGFPANCSEKIISDTLRGTIDTFNSGSKLKGSRFSILKQKK